MGHFCYHDKFSDTMAVVLKEVIDRLGPRAEILDIPAGAGRLSDRLRKHGFHVVSADINRARDDYCFSDMNKPLPFADGRFDAVISMEGIEHIIDYHGFIGELSRVTKQEGLIFLTTPNIACFYSRLMFMCTGNFFQFWPGQAIVNVKGEGIFDYGHISPLTWQQICFRFAHYGATPIALRGNKVKRKILLPVYVPFMLIGLPWIAYRLRRTRKGVKSLLGQTDYYREVEKFSYSLPAMFSRNIVIVLEKKRGK
ncbi:MAG: bifunctional 3-demethylubiquinone-9 3-methyltransferase/ 2-octaprenyl-6-hydroxy phenol methylase [Syntrophorhabdaceae bacterium PtaU1.Bin034]|nr:MAG: bifunctional 3-demethylubiquinone-9 3-methyltransferase/ 2-octaprenyl-6-hydroxy phenol methylase [Syntrophorhabdaceae bacterium PtaU1.Bin034]